MSKKKKEFHLHLFSHGANRLASNSLLEGLVFGHRTADSIFQKIDSLK